MKKCFLLILGVISALCVNADNIIYAEPCTIQSGVTSNKYNEDYMFNVALLNDVADDFTAFQFDLVLPEGMTIVEDAEFNSDRFEGTIKKGSFIPDATYGVKDKGNGLYRITLYDTDLQTIHGTSGTIMSFYYMTTADFKNTYAPIYVKDVVLTRPNKTDVKMACATSYATVGTFSNVEIQPEGVFPAAAVADLPEGTKVDLSQTTAIYGSSTNSVNASYSRSVKNKWNTVCLPFDAQSTENVQFYTVTSVSTSTIEATSVSTLPAGTAALAEVTGGTLSAAGTGALSATPKEGDMVGVFKPTTVTTAGTYYIANNEFHLIKENFKVGAFKAYLAPISGGAKSDVLEINIDESTAINAANIDLNAIEEVYGVNGARQNSLQKGMNIVKIGDKVMKVVVK